MPSSARIKSTLFLFFKFVFMSLSLVGCCRALVAVGDVSSIRASYTNMFPPLPLCIYKSKNGTPEKIDVSGKVCAQSLTRRRKVKADDFCFLVLLCTGLHINFSSGQIAALFSRSLVSAVAVSCSMSSSESLFFPSRVVDDGCPPSLSVLLTPLTHRRVQKSPQQLQQGLSEKFGFHPVRERTSISTTRSFRTGVR